MSNKLFDDLAKTLAQPMPRRRALRLLGSAVAVAALPGLRPRRALAAAAGGPCGRGGLTCAQQFGADVSECCGPIDKGNPQSNYWCCKPGECLRNPATGFGGGCCKKKCGKNCCYGDEECVEGECTSCPDDRVCGSTCCEEGAVCRNKGRGLCCVRSWRACEAGFLGVVKCCPPQDKCCLNFKTKTSVCCGAGQECTDGKCACKKGEKKCGDDCCKKNEDCSNGKCCPKGKVNCGDGRCCGDKDDCCEKMCCDGNSRICVKGTCCPSDRFLGSGKSARCCPPRTVASDGRCCPESDPECCEDGGLALVCGKGKTCVRGTCQKL